MNKYPAITLHYFDVRGRGQFIRQLLNHRGIPFTDAAIALGTDRSLWLAIRKQRERSGVFQKLPTLQWGELLLSETLVIMDFLHEQLGDAALLGAQQSLRHRMLTSSAFLDLLVPCLTLIWTEVFNPGVDLAKAAQAIKVRMQMHLIALDQTLAEWRWVEDMQKRPVTGADAVLWEALDMIRLTFAGTFDLQSTPHLAAFIQECPGAASFTKLLQDKPRTITARPGETEVLKMIHAAL